MDLHRHAHHADNTRAHLAGAASSAKGLYLSRQADDPRCARGAAGGDADDYDDNGADLGTLSTVASEPCALSAAEVDVELELCLQLRDWDPWGEPSQELMSVIDALRRHDVNRYGRGVRCLLRRAVVEQIASEATASQQMPEWMKYHVCARYYLQRGRATAWGEQS